MINYKNPKTRFKVEEREINECLCMLVIFCDLNEDSEQAKDLKRQLEKMEHSVHRGEFIN